MANDKVEIIEDNEEVITLTSADGEEVDFEEIAGICLNDKFYAILQPIELIEGMEEDEALVFEVTETENGDKFDLVLDDDVIDAVFEEYNKLLDQVESENTEETNN